MTEPSPGTQSDRPSREGDIDNSRPLSDTEKASRNWSMFCHLSALIGLGINIVSFAYFVPVGFVGPLITWLARKNEYPAADEHGREAANFQITAGGLQFVFCLIPVIGWFLLLPILLVTNIGMTLYAAIRASQGEPFRYPVSLRLLN